MGYTPGVTHSAGKDGLDVKKITGGNKGRTNESRNAKGFLCAMPHKMRFDCVVLMFMLGGEGEVRKWWCAIRI